MGLTSRPLVVCGLVLGLRVSAGVRPIRRHQSRLVVLVAGSSVVAKPRRSGVTVRVCWAQQAWARLSPNCVTQPETMLQESRNGRSRSETKMD